MSTTESEDDLDSKPTVRRRVAPPKKVQPRRSLSISSSIEVSDLDAYGDSDRGRKRQKKDREDASRLKWSDSEGEDIGAAAYKKFKSKSSVARKSALASTKRAKAIEARNNPTSNLKVDGHTGVGRQPNAKRKKRGEKKDFDVPSDEDGMECTMPDYVRDRRAQFEERSKKLKKAGLMLPPSYEDVYFSDNERINVLKERPEFSHIQPPAPYADIELPYSLGIIPAPIAQYLREYQVKGVAFLHELFVYQKGGILGDDMGLGKTVQVIAFLAAAYGKTGDERDKKRMRKMRRAQAWYPKTLIVCPGSLMANWQDEFRRWGWWHTDLYHGDSRQREDALAQAKSGMLEIMITTYTTYRIYKSEINTVEWDCVIADECHIVKERKSEITKALNDVNALCRIGLTGTAIQNKYEELWTILNFSNPCTFGPIQQWKQSISEPLKLGQSHNATVYELARARKTAKKLVENLLPQFFLRRMKTLIKDQLPKKTDRVVFCPLTSIQAKAYRNFVESDYVQTIKLSVEICDCGSKKKQGWCCYTHLENGDTWQQWVFPAIQYLQRLSNHVALLIPQSGDPKDKQNKDVDLLQVAMPEQWRQLNTTRDSILNYANPEFCGKWRVLRKLLKFWADQGGNKVLVFSHSVKLLKMLQQLFISTSYSVQYLDGSMSYEDRYTAVKEFNTDPTLFVFLISTRAGGIGLNITSANKVVVVDPNWNPSYDLQAQDRAYRIGQTRDVEVFRLVSQGTLEEIVYARQIYKQQMSNVGLSATSERRYFSGVQGRPGQKGEIFGLQNLFAFQDENVVLRDIVHKTNVAESRADLQIADLELDDENSDEPLSDMDEDHVIKRESQDADKEDAAMSQLVAEIVGEDGKLSRKGKSKIATSFESTSSGGARRDAIQAILASAGVSYTHENSEVVGSSRVEAELSKRAEEASVDTLQHARVFVGDSQSQKRRNGEIEEQFVYDRYDGEVGAEFQYRYRPPEDVKERQFCSMARWAGYEGEIVEFALLVESWTQAQRRDFLDEWYKWRRECVAKAMADPIFKADDYLLDVKYTKEDTIDVKDFKKDVLDVKDVRVDALGVNDFKDDPTDMKDFEEDSLDVKNIKEEKQTY